MLQRLKMSLTQPPRVVFFLNDSWLRILLYILLMPLILIVPAIIQSSINPGMNLDRATLLTQTIYQDLLGYEAEIIDGTLFFNEPVMVSFDYIDLNIGTSKNAREIIGFTFSEKELILTVGRMEYQRATYEELALTNFDFRDKTNENALVLSIAIRNFYNQQSIIDTFEVILLYFMRMLDYLLFILFMPLVMLLIFRHHQMTWTQRFKFSVYLTTIWVFVELFIDLINQRELGFLSILMLYIYHFWAYRSIIVIKKGGDIE
jgi:hypothetical protein